MSLLIVGSCSKITSNIVLALAKQNIYKKITISDLLPLYDHHERYYRLRKHLNDQRSNVPVLLEKLISVEQLSKQVNSHDDVLHVTHDYFQSVTSKQKLMEMTALLTQKKKNVLFVAPIEYDHFGEKNPEQTFLDAKSKVLQINPNAGFIRSDIQDKTELYAYIHKSKNILEEKLLVTPHSFKPKVVNSEFFSEQVVDQVKKGPQGVDVVVRGERERHYTEVAHNEDIEDHETKHQVGNIRLLVSRYRGPDDRFGTLLVSKFQ